MDYSIVVPVYNSCKTLPVLMQELNVVITKMKADFEIIFVDDCSNDDSWQVLKELKNKNNHIKIIRLANNVGQWMATLAGIKKTSGKFIITIDDDLEYDTHDIELLIQTYHQSNVYLLYGIPTEKKNKNLSYKLFFRLRDRFLRFFFDKIQTESFKIFKREIYFDEDGKMYSHLHFEAYTKFTIAKKYVGYVDVNYRSRYFGNSNHTLFMKAMLMVKYGIEYYKSPFRYPLYILLVLITVYFTITYLGVGSFGLIIMVKYIILIILLLVVGILGKYLSSLYFKLKGLPEYIIIEEF
jgi:glycosyltransferase involved in cell wall biosynthesis